MDRETPLEWIISLHNREDLEGFYEDMETEGGNLYIPNRAVELASRRPISRNTHYMLTFDEVERVKADPRVRGVDLLQKFLDFPPTPLGYEIVSGNFDKGGSPGTTDINWGLLQHTDNTNTVVNDWGSGGSSFSITDTVTVTASGKNVDVLIVDGHMDPAHPEYAVNADGTGGTRVVQYNWFQNDVGYGTGTYTYTPYVDPSYADNNGDGIPDRTDDNNHGAHCAGTVAGNTQGWARDANIYCISPYGTNPNWGTQGFSSATLWDYVRAWHNNKPINPVTGRRNPTVSNNSYGSAILFRDDGVGNYPFPTSITYRGSTFAPGRTLTNQELIDRDIDIQTAGSINYFYIQNYSNSIQADIEDAIDDGIIIVFAAGNDNNFIAVPTDQDWNNEITYLFGGFFSLSDYTARGAFSGQYVEPTTVVGALSTSANLQKASFSNYGSAVDVYSAGTAIQSALNTGDYISSVNDPRDSNFVQAKYQGTSMAAPQVTGMIGCLLENNPNFTQADINQWIIDNGLNNEMARDDSGGVNWDPTDNYNLASGENRILFWINQRKETGAAYPYKTAGYRSGAKLKYPRPRIRRRG